MTFSDWYSHFICDTSLSLLHLVALFVNFGAYLYTFRYVFTLRLDTHFIIVKFFCESFLTSAFSPVKGTVIRQEFHSRNGGEPEGTVSVTAYSSKPEELEQLMASQGVEPPSRIHGLSAITTTKKFGGDTGVSMSSVNTVSAWRPFIANLNVWCFFGSTKYSLDLYYFDVVYISLVAVTPPRPPLRCWNNTLGAKQARLWKGGIQVSSMIESVPKVS